MQILNTLNINTIIVAIVGGLLALQQWRSGNSKISSETLAAYQAKTTLNEETIRNQQDQINISAKEIGVLQGINQQKDKTLEEYKALIQGRNPQMEQILSKVVEFMEKVDNRLSKIEEAHVGPTTITTQVTHTPQPVN